MSGNRVREHLLQEVKKISEEKNITKERAFFLWVCENVLKISDNGNAEEAITISESESYGIDIFHMEEDGDRDDQYVCWSQVKFSEELNLRITKDDIDRFVGTIDSLETCPENASFIFKQKSQDFARIGKTDAPIRKQMFLVITGEITSEAESYYKSNDFQVQRLSNVVGPSIEFVVYDLQKILAQLTISHTPRLRVEFNETTIERRDPITDKRSVVGYIRADDLIKITKKHEDVVFLENPRQSLGTTPTNKEILYTLEDEELKLKFWKLNNGITAICDNLADAHDQRHAYEISNFKIVNGRQTTFTLENFPSSLDSVYLFLAIHEAVDDNERMLISKATNTQNAIKKVDLLTNTPMLLNLKLQSQNFPDFYFERQTREFKSEDIPTQRRITSRRVLEKNSIARIYYAYAVDPNDAMETEKKFFDLDNEYCSRIFENRNIRDLIVPHAFMDMIKLLHAEWSGVQEHDRDRAIIGKRNVRYYLLRLIYESLFSITTTTRIAIEDTIINRFQNLSRSEKPEIFLEIAEATYLDFITNFDQLQNETWPQSILAKLDSDPDAEPAPYDVMYSLKINGRQILPSLLRNRRRIHVSHGDPVQKKLLSLS